MSNPYQQQPEDPRGGPPQYQASGDQYGAGQYGGGQYGGGRPGTAPPEVERLLTLTLVSAAIYLVNQVLGLITTSSADMSATYEQSGLTPEQIAQTQSVGVIFSVVVIVVALALYALVYVFLKKGKNWARVLGIVLAILSTLGVLLGLLTTAMVGLSGTGIIGAVLGLLLVVVNVLWLVTAFKAPVKHWFAPPRMA
ncbi:hypothetical protein RCG67_02270 [Kocuria sp. CPCC 205292]|uniref:hypothetical protein n=1 Tax=Kocuria cellulosilytica TaxID=3071451 RepID=UPI0034D3CACB